MSKIQQTTTAVRIRNHHHHVLQERNIPPRSQLYCLAPCEVGTIWRESLTGYINRLGGMHHISPRAFVAGVIIPQLAEQLPLNTPLNVFLSLRTMSLNGAGVLGQSWAAILGQLTAQSNVHLLTLPWWVGDLSPRRQLRRTPAWCPACLFEWRDNGYPIYQPLLWMFQMVTICPRHETALMDQCPHCHKRQAVIGTNKTRLGECTHCASWLGLKSQVQHEEELSEELITWQEWIIHALEELHSASLVAGVLQWEPFFRHLARSLQEQKAYSKLAQLTGTGRQNLYRWVNEDDTYTPTLETIFRFCYACDMTPLQVMNGQLDHLQQAIRGEAEVRVPRPHYHPRQVNHEACQALLQEFLDGREEPLALSQIARRLDIAPQQLRYHFPKECTVITQLAKEHRNQRKEQRLVQIHDEVRQRVLSLYAQGLYPSQQKLKPLLPSGLMRLPEARDAWRATLRELGYEP